MRTLRDYPLTVSTALIGIALFILSLVLGGWTL